MKARNNKTGEIVTSFGFSKEFGTVSYIDSKSALTFNTPSSGEWTILDEESTFDWQSFRNQAAKDILCAMIPKENNIIGKDLVGYSIMIADELIKQLKEKEEQK